MFLASHTHEPVCMCSSFGRVSNVKMAVSWQTNWEADAGLCVEDMGADISLIYR